VKRIEHFNDPDAPAANSLVPAASAVVVDQAGRILLHRRDDNGLWSIPGGAMEVGERIADTVVREVKEETGLEVEPEAIVGIYSDPRHVVDYANGEVRQQFPICFACRVVGGEPATSEESLEVGFFAPAAIEAMPMHESIRLRIRHYLAHRFAVVDRLTTSGRPRAAAPRRTRCSVRPRTARGAPIGSPDARGRSGAPRRPGAQRS
jgi:ADP-ribose pyrophosphatase YjhB (NUDIX family)